jgi:hypothetical protein
MGLRIEQVDGWRGRRRFTAVPWQIHDPRRHPGWTQPLRMLTLEVLSPRNPVWRDADRALFVAERDGRVVGRIAAIENRAHNRFHGDRVGFFGWFDCVDDDAVAGALLAEGSGWLAARGLDRMRGPMNPNLNYECGMLVDDFAHRTAFLTPWNPAYYPALMERAGFATARDLLAYDVPLSHPPPHALPRYGPLAERALADGEVTFRNLSFRHWDRDVAAAWQVYDESWRGNWGYSPMPREEFVRAVRDLKFLVWPELTFGVEVAGRPAGICLCIPDFNDALVPVLDGRLLPRALPLLLRARSLTRKARVIALGTLSEHRVRGLFPVLIYELQRRAAARGLGPVEASWVLEDNVRMRRPIEWWGGTISRRWRIYERPVPAHPPAAS